MGRVFVEHLDGPRIVVCAKCKTQISNHENLESHNFRGASGNAFLFKKAVNLNYSRSDERTMTTGRHFVRDVFCKICNFKLGWMYEFACIDEQMFKEGKVILEQAHIEEID